MIDEFFERLIDRLSERVPAAVRPRWILLSDSSVGWRAKLYFGTAFGKVRAAFTHISNEDNMDLFLRETAERSDDRIARIFGFLKEQLTLLSRLESRGRTIRFTGMLFLLMLAVLGVAATGKPGMGVMSASLCVMWLSVAVESDYKPVSGVIRQQYLAATLLRTLSISLMLIHYVSSYTARGVPNNIVLQSAMIIMLVIHGMLFLALVFLNTRQPLFLRALSAVTGCAPALTAAAALALAASCISRPWPAPLSGVLGVLGTLCAFMGDQLITMTHLGGIRLKYYSIWVCLLMTGGFALMLFGVWTYTL